ncbi:MAG: Blue-light-activated protein [Myxococcaceae bacterium]|nr:Blue-light-activated protein [Myxococcaceae bacterium]
MLRRMSDAQDPDGPAACRALRQRVIELERELGESRSASTFLESVLQAVPAFISNLDPDLNIRFLNRYQPGHTLANTIGRSVFDYIAPEDRAIARHHIDQARETGQIVSYTLHRATGPHGAPSSYLTRVAPVREIDGRVGACLAFIDTTDEHERERELRETQESLRLALEATGFGLWSWDLQTGEVVWDERMRALHGSGVPLPPAPYAEQLVHPDDRALVRASVAHMRATGVFEQQQPHRVVWPDGTVRWLLTVGRTVLDEQGKTVKLVGGALDVTRQQELEEQLRKGQRMDAVANLSAGIAHNFNNMLAVILPILELATPLVPAHMRPMLRDGSHAASRAAELVKQLMAYAGQATVPQRTPCDIKATVEAAVSLCRHAYDTRIELSVEMPEAPLFVACDAGQIEQVLVNLLLNARDSILSGPRSRGRVLVVVRDSSSSAADPSARQLSIDVADDGSGMSEQVRARMFEPFFTTKPVGKGTGLGLATSYAIVRDHGGVLTCESTQGAGSRFTVTLPLATKLVAEAAPALATPATSGTHVLVVDDDDAVRSTFVALLGTAHLQVYEAESCATAIRILRAHPAMQVILLDRSMPDGPGERIIPELRQIAPAARILFLSGQRIQASAAAMADAVLQKPISGAALLAAIAKVLPEPPR